MIASFFSLVVSLVFFYFAVDSAKQNTLLFEVIGLSHYFVLFSLSFLVVALVATALSWNPVYKMQEKALGCTQELYAKDRLLHGTLAFLFLFALFSLALTLLPIGGGPAYTDIVLLTLWIFFFGVAFDLLRLHLKRLFSYTRYSWVLERMQKSMQTLIRSEQEPKAMALIGILLDSCNRAIDDAKISRVTSGLSALRMLLETYTKEVARQEAMAPPEPAESVPSFTDKLHYMSIYVSERLLWLYERALEHHLYPVAEEILATLGKLSIFFCSHYHQVATNTVSTIAKCAELAKKEGLDSLLTRASLTLSEVCKAFLVQSRARNESYEDLFVTTILEMEKIVKMLYRQNKSISPVLLMQPFAEVGQFLGSDAMQNVLDREAILREIRRILTEFQSLEMVMQNIEEVVGVSEDTTSTFSEDHPYIK